MAELQRVNANDAIEVGGIYRFDYRFGVLKRVKFRQSVVADLTRRFSELGVSEWKAHNFAYTPLGFVTDFSVTFRASSELQGMTVGEVARAIANVPGVNPDFVQGFRVVGGGVDPGTEPIEPEPGKKPQPAFGLGGIFNSPWFWGGVLLALFAPSYSVQRRKFIRKRTVKKTVRRPQLPFKVERV